jgi:aromatic-L-amino-acid/L-tryptophan decarboxylase
VSYSLASMPGDLPPDEFRSAMHRVADLVADYLEGVGDRPVLPTVSPGEVRRVLPAAPPEEPEPVETILDDYLRVIEPNLTHWNHPGFFAYFAITGSGPGILGETLAAALNVNAMLWRTSPAATELEERVCEWLGQMMDLPAELRGHINDTASSSSLVALAVARHRLPGLDVRERGLSGRPAAPPLTVYASDQAHSSIDKAAIVLGVGQENVRRVASDEEFRMSVPALAEAIARDRAEGRLPMAVVATAGTTSTTSVDPIPEIADLCARQGIWLHVDTAYAGSAAICPELRRRMPGLERADSLVVNPHKWLFTPVDCSVLFVRDPALLKDAFSLVPEYLRTDEAGVTNLMDYGFQLGRRFRALKLWMVIRAFGAEGLRARIREHCALARELADRLAGDPRFELAAPVPFSTVCFRARVEGPPQEQDRFNERLLARINAAGSAFLSHTVLTGRYTLRVAIGNLRTERAHVEALWDLLTGSLEDSRT